MILDTMTFTLMTVVAVLCFIVILLASFQRDQNNINEK
jgi:hypothetical protein